MRVCFLLAALLTEAALLRGDRVTPLSDLISKAKEQLSSRTVNCEAEIQKGSLQLEKARSVAALASNAVTKAQADLTKVQVELDNTDKALSVVPETNTNAKQACTEQAAMQKVQHELVKADAAVLGNVADGFRCDALLECGTSLVFKDSHMRKLASSLRSKEAQEIAKLGQAPTEEAAPPACVVPTIARCENVADGTAQLHSHLRDSANNLAKSREATDNKCRQQASDAIVHEDTMRAKKADLQDRAANAMRVMNAAEDLAGQRQSDFEKIETLTIGWKEACDTDLENFQFKVEQLGRIRAKKEGLVRDCEVGPWQKGPCSTECGGGTRHVTRTVVSPPETGHQCPALEREEECNRAECPEDCEMGEWMPWTECTVQCGGGTQARNRMLIKPSKFGGSPCPGTSMTQLCHVEACDVDCQLSEWGLWGQCSQRCGGGAQTRTKSVTAETIGEGTCWRWDDPLMRDFQPCAVTPCVPPADPLAPASLTVNPAAGFTICDGVRLDVVFLVDASGSVKPEQWDAEKALIDGVLSHLEIGGESIHAAILSYGENSETVSGFTSDENALTSALGTASLLAPAGSDFAHALGAAEILLDEREGDDHAPATIVLLTDGNADTAKNRHEEAAYALRAKGTRVIGATVGYAPKLEPIVSKPSYGNLVSGGSFGEMNPIDIARTLCPPKPPAPVQQVVPTSTGGKR